MTETLLLLLLSHFSCIRLCATPEMAAHQAPPSPGFSRQEHWSGLPFPSPDRNFNMLNFSFFPFFKSQENYLLLILLNTRLEVGLRRTRNFIKILLGGRKKTLSETLEDGKASPVAQMVKNLPTLWETWVQSLGQENPLENEMAIHSSILAWGIPWTEEAGGLQTMGFQSN